MVALPFALRRPLLLTRDLLVDREHPDLEALGAIDDPERFVWSILPHAARTFSACIALLPARAARAAAVAYLYCRILDTYEDLATSPDEAVAALHAFARRFDGAGPPAPAPPLGDARAVDARDRSHLLLVARCGLVDRVHATLEPAVAGIIVDLVRDMAAGMAWAARTFSAQGGVLADDDQLMRYCRAVLGNPVVFVTRMTALRRRGHPDLSPDEHEAAMVSGEFIQLANVTRDIEKDLPRGVAFDPSLRPLLGRTVPRPDRGPCDDAEAADQEAVRLARARLLDLALDRAPAYGRLIPFFGPSGVSLTRASALLMLLFTERFYLGCAARVGRKVTAPRGSSAGLIGAVLPAALSAAASDRRIARSLAHLADARVR